MDGARRWRAQQEGQMSSSSYYEVDSDVQKHNLAMEDYGEEAHWVLLEPAA